MPIAFEKTLVAVFQYPDYKATVTKTDNFALKFFLCLVLLAATVSRSYCRSRRGILPVT